MATIVPILMRLSFFSGLPLAGCLALACGPGSAPRAPQSAEGAGSATRAGAEGSRASEATLASVGLDSLAMDTGADPCADFYQFACGKWLEQTEIPADEPRWTRSFNEIQKKNELALQKILEGAAAGGSRPDKLGTFYAACMDEAAIQAAGAAPIQPLLAKAGAVEAGESLTRLVAELHGLGIWAFFDVFPVQDPKDATRWIASLDQNGLGLPDRDYYLRQDEKSTKLREVYVGHVQRMLQLAGLSEAEAKRGAADVLKLETELAKVSKTRVERRDPTNMFNRVSLPELQKKAPSFGWRGYLGGLSLGGVQALNVTAPAYFAGLQPVFEASGTSALRTYLKWQIVHSMARHLSEPFVAESFALHQALTGQAEDRPRWRRCISATDDALGELLGKAYVEKHFAGQSKQAAEAMVQAISQAFGEELARLDWMDEATRQRAMGKLSAMTYLIGYPDEWKSYDFDVSPAAHAQNVLAARAFEEKRELAKVGQPVDRTEWQMSPPTVNAYYDPQRNQMVFPAGILQPPFYSVDSAAAVNLGAIGMVVGHELTHGFDDEGSQYDAKGNLDDWWSPEVEERFKEKTQCVADQYSSYEALPDLHLDGRLTLGENIADLGGVKLAFAAYRNMRGDSPRVSAGGLSEEQQFFLAMAQGWCAKARPEFERMMVQVNPHSPPRFRVRGPLSDLPEFAEAFSCPPKAPMHPENACTVW